jgi:hypothetical protein
MNILAAIGVFLLCTMGTAALGFELFTSVKHELEWKRMMQRLDAAIRKIEED